MSAEGLIDSLNSLMVASMLTGPVLHGSEGVQIVGVSWLTFHGLLREADRAFHVLDRVRAKTQAHATLFAV